MIAVARKTYSLLLVAAMCAVTPSCSQSAGAPSTPSKNGSFSAAPTPTPTTNGSVLAQEDTAPSEDSTSVLEGPQEGCLDIATDDCISSADFYTAQYKGIEHVCKRDGDGSDRCVQLATFNGYLSSPEIWCEEVSSQCSDLDPNRFYRVKYDFTDYVCEIGFLETDKCVKEFMFSGAVILPELWCTESGSKCSTYDPEKFYGVRYDSTDYVCEIGYGTADKCEREGRFHGSIITPDLWCTGPTGECAPYDPTRYFETFIGGQRVLCESTVLGGSRCVNLMFGTPRTRILFADWECDSLGACERTMP